MIADRDFNFSDYISTNSQQREMALCCEERIRSHILDSDYNSGLLLRAVAHQLMIYISSFILRHENMEHELSTKDFPYLPGNYWQQPDSIKFNKKSYMPIFSYSLSNKCFVEYTGSYKVHLPYRILNKFITFISIYWLALKKKQKKNFNLEKNFISGEKVLRLCLKDLAVDIEIPKKDKKKFINNFIDYVESYVNFFCSETNNLLYSGTLCKIISSSRAFAYSCEKLPVIVEDHGDFSTLLHDEPATRLGEIGLSTVLKTYGDIEWIGKILNNQKHLISKPEIVQISSNHLEGIKRKNL